MGEASGDKASCLQSCRQLAKAPVGVVSEELSILRIIDEESEPTEYVATTAIVESSIDFVAPYQWEGEVAKADTSIAGYA